MIVIGLTGGIGMGKSTAAAILREMGLPVYHADKAVHALLKKNGIAVKQVAKIFPRALKNGAIDRAALGHIVFRHPARLSRLEKILHPLVHKAEKEFLRRARKGEAKAAVLEIPLLFETGAQKRCDYVICVTAPKKIQHARVMRRPGMTRAKLKGIYERQMPDAQKRKLADFVIDTGDTHAGTKKQLKQILHFLHL